MMKLTETETRELNLELFKSAVLSAVYSLFNFRRKQAVAQGTKYLMQDLANDAGVTKSQVSRWFNGEASPNWRLSTLFDMAEALNGEVRIEIVDRATNSVHSSSGQVSPHVEETSSVLDVFPVYGAKGGEVIDLNHYHPDRYITAPRDPIFYASGEGVVSAPAA